MMMLQKTVTVREQKTKGRKTGHINEIYVHCESSRDFSTILSWKVHLSLHVTGRGNWLSTTAICAAH